jgi:helix-turn-helix protein
VSVQAMGWVLEAESNRDLAPSSRLVLLALANHADAATGICWPSVPQIAREANLSDRQTRRLIRDLVGRGILAVRAGGGRHKPNRYTLSAYLAARETVTPATGFSWETLTPRVGKGDTAMSPEPSRTVTTTYTPEFDEFWTVYPRKEAKRAAARAFDAALRRGTAEDVIAGAVRYRARPDRRKEFTKHPATWLNGDCWLDDAEIDAPPAAEPEFHEQPPPPSPEDKAALAEAIAAQPWSRKRAAS